MLSLLLLRILLLCLTKAYHLHPIIISKIVFSVNGKKDIKLIKGKCSEMHR